MIPETDEGDRTARAHDETPAQNDVPGADAREEESQGETEPVAEEEAAEEGGAEPAGESAEQPEAREPEGEDSEAEESAAQLERDESAADESVPDESATDESAEDPNARPEALRLLEALLFAATEPVEEKVLGKRLPSGTDVHASLRRLQLEYAPRGINLVRIGTRWAFRTANDLAWLLTHQATEPKKLSRAAVETLAIIAYHQPVTRAEIEDVRGVAVAKGTLDVLLETGWIRPRGRRKAPGRPLTYGTTDQFLSHFGLEALNDLPGLDELKGAGLFDGQLPPGFAVPSPSDDPALHADEEAIDDTPDLDLGLAPRPEEPPAENENEGEGKAEGNGEVD
ncbi:Segregation and condensation protein B [Rhodovulum sp. PH10]|nr:Segregation and condensation protein B [Rhodovulum sp. PH10]